MRQYRRASTAERAAIKDVGGYVGGHIRGGRRIPENISYRTLITLDLDFGTAETWDLFTLMYNCAAVLHSTHSHTEETPKYRLIIPLDRKVAADEYSAIARKVADNINIDLFDHTGFQSFRLMYWPSVSVDAEYYYREQKGEALSADSVLGEYIDWTDSSEWPTCATENKEVLERIGKQEDPRTKNNLIGAFARTYSLTEGIARFLADSYEQLREDRYTYAKGSTAGGLVIYEDLYAYSHHGTDPTSGQLCNIFDLVRVHKFGHLDTRSYEDITKAPSYVKAIDFVAQDPDTKATIARERLAQAQADFNDIGVYEDGGSIENVLATAEPDQEQTEERVAEAIEWAKKLDVDSKGKPRSTAVNWIRIMRNDPALKDLFRLNLFDNRPYITRSAPWRKVPKAEPVRNVDFAGLRSYIETAYGITSRTKLEDAFSLEIQRGAWHPIRERVLAETWDGTQRAETLFIDYLGAVDSPYTRAAARKMLVGAIKRIFEPGCKFDLVITLVGEQGAKKSTFISKLASGYYSDSFKGVKGNESIEQLVGAWLIEIPELAGLRHHEIEPVKKYITIQEDRMRPAYGKVTENYPRQCIFIATTNEDEFLRDPSGNRRFVPITTVKSVGKRQVPKLTPEVVWQIWAESYQLYRAGEPVYFSDEMEVLAEQVRLEHSEVDERLGLIQRYLYMKLPEEWDSWDLFQRRNYIHGANGTIQPAGVRERTEVSIVEIWCECLKHSPDNIDPRRTRPINELMRSLDEWESSGRSKRIPIYGTQRYYRKSDRALI